MSRIFLRIFLSFWLAMVLIVAGSAWLNYRIWKEYGPSDVPSLLRERMVRAVEATAADLIAGDVTALRSQRRRGRRFIHVIDEEGRSSSPLPLPPRLERLRDLDSATGRREGADYLAVDVVAADGARYRVLGVVPVPPRVLTGGRRGTLMRLAVAVFVSALVCWLLAWFLLRPVHRLRSAAARLAAGDLSGRASPAGSYGNDELGALGREFDRMASALEEASATQQQLLRDVSHELRSPLARLQVALELARSAGDAQRGAYLDRIEAETERLDALIGDILTLSRHEKERLPLPGTPVDLAALLGRVVTDARFEGQREGREVRYACSVATLAVIGDEKLLHRAFENVIRNALLHTPPGTAVTVCVDADEGEARVRVRDEGPGVPAEQLEQIFLPFHRVDRARSEGGHGIGLAIARQVVLRHGGKILAANRAAGGLEVTVSLPLASARAGDRPAA